MREREIREGMRVRAPDGRLLGRVSAVGETHFELEPGALRPETFDVPLASDDAAALEVAKRLVRDAGFDPVVVGGLDRAREFDVGTKVYTRLLTAKQLREELGLK